MQSPSTSLIIACVALLAAVACAMSLQFSRRPSWLARTGFGMSMGIAFIMLGTIVV